MSLKKDEIIDISKSFIKLANSVQDQEKRFHFLVGIVHLADDHLDEHHKVIFVKELAHYVATQFSRYKNLQSTHEMLQIWKFVGKYSKSFGMEGVLKQLDSLGYFKQFPEFYIMWCEFYGAQGNEDAFNKVIQRCKENGAWTYIAQHEILGLRTRFFSCEDDRTDLLFQNLQANEEFEKLENRGISANAIVEDRENKLHSVVPEKSKSTIEPKKLHENPALAEIHNNRRVSEFPNDLSRVTEECEDIENSSNSKNSDKSIKLSTTESASKSTNLNPKPEITPRHVPMVELTTSARKSVPTIEANSSKKIMEPPGARDFAAGASFSTNLYRNVVDVFANTLPLSHEAVPLVVEETQNTEPTNDYPRVSTKLPDEPAFEIFCDERTQQIEEIKAVHEKPTLKTRLCDEPKLVRDSPLAKKSKSNIDFALKPDVSYDDEMLENVAVDKIPEPEPVKGEVFKRPISIKSKGILASQNLAARQVHSSPTATIQLRDDDVTVAGSHKMSQPMMNERATSTPQRDGAPPVNEDVTKSLALDNKRQLDFDMETDEFFPPATMSEKVKFFEHVNEDEAISEFQRRLSINNPSKLLQDCRVGDGQTTKAEMNAKKFGNEDGKYDLAVSLGRLSLLGAKQLDDVDFNETTGTGRVRESISGNLNPWDERKRADILSKFLPPTVDRHDFLDQKCPRFEINGVILLGGERFDVKEIIGRGGFATVYKCINENQQSVAVKHQVPPCPWEFYICKSLNARLPSQILQLVMSVQDIYIFSNASAIVYDYYRYGTLLDLSNNYKKDSEEVNGFVLGVIGIQMAKTLKYVHEALIIHGDVKPDNFIVYQPMVAETPQTIGEWELFLSTPYIKLIDWGRSIDMKHFPGKTFRGRAGTECFDCVEMTKNLPWTYQTDYYGFVCTIYVLMFQEYMKTQFYQGRFKPLKSVKRRLALRSQWEAIFDEFLNIPNCHSQPDWTKTITDLEKHLKNAVTVDEFVWKKSIERFNNKLRNC